ncbi:unnamed protein product [Thlaspi arvense]|uniref:Leucine-rich repeat-containing N-terminal plant-type domain-containing protein n=1 Tax=Thlaspi arvense TaxID=13288 RepID=A0AAU9RI52_THLAR|nr:unnamed protein product [Thlaspi arvense]
MLASADPSAYPKMETWKLKSEYGDCCLWNGIECDMDTSHVIGLDISSNFIYGSINTSSNLFRLVHLQRLNLADNNFNYSEIPSAIGNLSRLAYVYLSKSKFYGEFPRVIFLLPNFQVLSASQNLYLSGYLAELHNRSPLKV